MERLRGTLRVRGTVAWAPSLARVWLKLDGPFQRRVARRVIRRDAAPTRSKLNREDLEVGYANLNDSRCKHCPPQASRLPCDERAHSWDGEGQKAALGGVDKALLDQLVS